MDLTQTDFPTAIVQPDTDLGIFGKDSARLVLKGPKQSDLRAAADEAGLKGRIREEVLIADLDPTGCDLYTTPLVEQVKEAAEAYKKKQRQFSIKSSQYNQLTARISKTDQTLTTISNFHSIRSSDDEVCDRDFLFSGIVIQGYSPGDVEIHDVGLRDF